MMGKKYTFEFHDSVLKRFRSGEPVISIASSTGVARSTIYKWINQSIEESRQIEISLYSYRLLEKKVARLEKMIEVITKAKCSPGAPLKVKLSALESLYGQYSVHLLCEALDVPRGTFYNHIFRNKRDKTWFTQRREELRIEIKQIYDDSNQVFGAKKICAILKERGHSITKEMVAELMRDLGLCSIRQDAKDLYNIIRYFRQKGELSQKSESRVHTRIVELVGNMNISSTKEANSGASIALLYSEGKLCLYLVQFLDGETIRVLVDLELDEKQKVSSISLCLPELFNFKPFQP